MTTLTDCSVRRIDSGFSVNRVIGTLRGSKTSLVESNDGLGRPLRPIQRQGLTWIDERWGGGKHLVISAGVGVGKSLIVRSVQRKFGGVIITPSNQLCRQYKKTYKSLNIYIGKDHYKCPQSQGPCTSSCTNCPLLLSRQRAATDDTVFNPMSFFYYMKSAGAVEPEVTLIDEAHVVLSMLRTLASNKVPLFADERRVLDVSNIDYQNVNDLSVIEAIDRLLPIIDAKAHAALSPGWASRHRSRAEKLRAMRNYMMSEPERFAVWWEKNSINTLAVRVPRSLIKKVLRGRVILLSATMFTPDIRELLGDEPYDFLDLGTPIPIQNRRVMWSPSSFKHNFQEMDAKALTQRVEEIVREYGGPAIVHTTYALARSIEHFWKDKSNVLFHDKLTKEDSLNSFMKNGGVFVASGCAEGLDLHGDLCRLNVITKINYPSLMDRWVQKRKALPDGDVWYTAEALKHLMQATGRSTRGEDDYSITIVLDPALITLIDKSLRYNLVPEYFWRSICWKQTKSKAA